MKQHADDVVIVATMDQDQSYRALMWRCEGCREIHHIVVRGQRSLMSGASWSWNGSTSKPTLTPALLKAIEGNNPIRCHSFVRDGEVQFLADSDHALAGKTVPMKTENANPFLRDD